MDYTLIYLSFFTMRIHRFFVELDLEQLHKAAHPITSLPKEAAHHCIQVLRYKSGDSLTLFNGDGFDYLATIDQINGKQATAMIQRQVDPANESPIQIHLFQGIARGEKMDLIIQKATELGVNQITPFFSEFCNVKLDGKRLQKKLSHWQQVVVSACEQCGRARVPVINSPIGINQIAVKESKAIVLEPSGSLPLKQLDHSESIAIFVGPEGGFSENDLKQLEQYHCQPVILGSRILRTETAGLATIACLQLLFGDF